MDPHATLVILPERRQRVQTFFLFTSPFSMTRILWIFGCHMRRLLLWAWLMVLPKIGFFPHISQIWDMVSFS